MEWLFDTLKLTSYENKIRSVDELIEDIDHVITSIDEIQATFDDEVFDGKPFDHLEKQQVLLKVCCLNFMSFLSHEAFIFAQQLKIT